MSTRRFICNVFSGMGSRPEFRVLENCSGVGIRRVYVNTLQARHLQCFRQEARLYHCADRLYRGPSVSTSELLVRYFTSNARYRASTEVTKSVSRQVGDQSFSNCFSSSGWISILFRAFFAIVPCIFSLSVFVSSIERTQWRR